MDEEQVDLLVRICGADVQRRLVREVIDGLTPAERKQLRTAVLGAVEEGMRARVEELVKAQIETWIGTVAKAALSGPKWAAVTKDVESKLNAYTITALNSPAMDQILADAVRPALRNVVREEVRKLLPGGSR